MPSQSRPTVKRTIQATRPIESSAPQHRQTALAPLLRRPLPSASLERAKSRFKKFNLSKFPKDSLPHNYVSHDKKHPAAHNVQTVQRKIIAAHLQKVGKAAPPDRGMTVVLPEAQIKDLLSSFNKRTGTMELIDLMKLIAKNMRGTEFYAKGDPTLNRLALRARLKEVMATFKPLVKK